jgi:hypothetical protein
MPGGRGTDSRNLKMKKIVPVVPTEIIIIEVILLTPRIYNVKIMKIGVVIRNPSGFKAAP